MSVHETYRGKLKELKCGVIIPTYNNAGTLADIISRTLEFTDQVIVVNDGSTDDTPHVLKEFSQLTVISYADNVGKGWALRQGFDAALERGYDYAITIDSDGQHRPEEIPLFIDQLETFPGSLVIGSRNMTQEGVPGTSNFGHRFSNFWYWLETGINLPDTQSGYRLYPLRTLKEMKFYTTKYELELEILVRAAWKGIPVIPVAINVIYPKNRISHFRLFTDFARISVLNSVLVVITVLYHKPVRFFNNLKKENRRAFIQKHILQSGETNAKITGAIMLGLFLGVAPIWGFHIIACLAFAHLLRLSKVLVVAAAHISIPPMIPLLLYVSYKLGGVMLGNHQELAYDSGFDFLSVQQNIVQYVVGSLGLGVLLSICFGALSYLTLSLFRKNPHLV